MFLLQMCTCLDRIQEEFSYTCGSPLMGDGQPFTDTLVVRESLECSSPMETIYYAGNIMSDHLVIQISPDERAEIDDDIRTFWTEGMECPVEGCQTTFTKYSDLRLHWSLIIYFLCEKCAFRSPRRNWLQRHYRNRHSLAVEEAKALSVAGKEQPNSKFLDPGSTLMPVMGGSCLPTLC